MGGPSLIIPDSEFAFMEPRIVPAAMTELLETIRTRMEEETTTWD